MVVVISIVGYCKIHQSENLSALLLENVEALADDEERGIITATDVNSDEPIIEFSM